MSIQEPAQDDDNRRVKTPLSAPPLPSPASASKCCTVLCAILGWSVAISLISVMTLVYFAPNAPSIVPETIDFSLVLPSRFVPLMNSLTHTLANPLQWIEDKTGRRLYIPALPEDYGFFIRKGGVPQVLPITDEDIQYGSLYGRVFSVMRLFQRLTKRPCMAMHHLEGYDSPPKNAIGILLDNNKNYIRAMNVEIIGNSTHIVSDEYESTLCMGKTSTLTGRNIIYITYIEYSDDYYIKYPKEIKESYRKTGGIRMVLRLEGLASLCVQQALNEISGASKPCH